MTLRKVDPIAVEAAVMLSPMPASLVRDAIGYYVDALMRRELAKNRTVVRLAGMAVGDSWWGYRPGRAQTSIQTLDKRRARLLLKDPAANWKMENRQGRRVVVRTA